jgi:hypothetical protein
MKKRFVFPISRDPPEGGTSIKKHLKLFCLGTQSFQFLGIPPKGEHHLVAHIPAIEFLRRFQFLGIPPKGELT